MYIMGKMLAKLHIMLKLHEKGILNKAKTLVVLAIWEGKIQKDNKKPQGEKGKAKGKNKIAYALKTKIPPPPKRDNPTKDSIYHHCKEVGHWRRNYSSYHAELKKRKNARLKGIRKLNHGALSFLMGNEMRATVEAIRSFDLILPSVLIIVLDNCHFEPTLTRGVVLISRLVKNGYIHTFTNYGISVSKDNVFYFNAIPRDGIYEIDMHNLYPNLSSNYNVRNKRAKHGLDSYYLWHCHLGHINKKHMDMLQRDGLLQPTHDKSHENSSGSHGLLEMSESDKGLEIIQEEDIQPSENTSKEHNEVAPIEKFRMENSKKGYIPMMENPDYRKSRGAKTPTEVKRMQRVPYASAIDWKSDKQSIAAMSSTEARYIVVVEALMEAVWMRKFIDGLGGVMPSNKRPMEMLCVIRLH
nr:zinc finger, CCHC-type [Tanacetum cinerariifolium]